MGLVKCPDCGKMISERATTCPNCGCPAEFFEKESNIDEATQTVDDQDNFSTDSEADSNADEIALTYDVLSRNMVFSNGHREYIYIRREYEIIAGQCSARIRSIYTKKSFGEVISYAVDLMNQVIPNLVDESVKSLYKLGVIISAENFLSKNVDLAFNYEDMIAEVVEKYAEITGEQRQLEQFRELQKASRSHFVGGGFGVKGAIKGTIKAGMMNAGLNFIRSFGDSKREEQDAGYIRNKISALQNSDFCKDRLINGAYTCVISVFNAMLRECVPRDKGIVPYSDSDRFEAKNLYDATSAYEKDINVIIDNYIKALNIYPYIRTAYKTIIGYAIDKSDYNSLDNVFFLMYCLGIMQTEYGESPYDNVEANYLILEYIQNSEILSNLKYDDTSLELYQSVAREIDNMQKSVTEKVGEFPFANYRYLQLEKYIKKCELKYGKGTQTATDANDDGKNAITNASGTKENEHEEERKVQENINKTSDSSIATYSEESFDSVVSSPDALQLIVKNTYRNLEDSLKNSLFKTGNTFKETISEYENTQTIKFPNTSVKTYRLVKSPLGKGITNECADNEYVFSEVVRYDKYSDTKEGYIVTDKRIVYRKIYASQKGNSVKYENYMLSDIVDYKEVSYKKGLFSKAVSIVFLHKNNDGSLTEANKLFSYGTKSTKGVCDLNTVLKKIIDARKNSAN